MTDRTPFQHAAIRAGEWLVRTQISDVLDANRGRFIYARNLDSGYTERSTGWQTGFGLMACLSLHRLTGEQKYLDSAALALSYIRSLQILDGRNRRLFGAIREETPQSEWLHPRDALSAAWGMLAWHRATGERDALERAVFFADWMLTYAMCDGWPIATVNLGPGGRDTDDLLSSVQGGAILFLLDLWQATRDVRYYEAALRMSDYHVRHLLTEEGEVQVIIDPLGNNPGAGSFEKWPQAWREMHRINDDFGGIALVDSFHTFRKPVYRQRVQAYARWVARAQLPNGGFLIPEAEVGSATAPIFLHQFATLAEPGEAVQARQVADRALARLLQHQQASSDPQVDGAFLCLDNQCRCGNGRWINIRCTTYAIFALLLRSGHSAFPLRPAPAA